MHYRSLTVSTTALALSCFVGHAHAQMATVIPPSQFQGPFAGQAIGVQLSRVGTEEISPLRIRTPGLTLGELEPWTEARFDAPDDNHCDYSAEALFAHWVPQLFSATWEPGSPLSQPRLGAMCTGGDLTPPVNCQGRMQFLGVDGVHWYTLSFTTSTGSVGLPGSAIRLAVDGPAPSNPAGWIYTYTSEGSTRIRSELVDTTTVEYTAAQLGDEGGVSATREVEALDWGMGMISVTGNAEPSTLQPQRNRFYFSLDQAWINEVFGVTPPPMTVLVGSQGTATTTAEINSATVYAMFWEDGEWSLPLVAFTPSELLGSTTYNASIDALSVDSRPSDLVENPSRVVFSLTVGSTVNGQSVDQILVTQPASASPVLPQVNAKAFSTPSGTKVSDKVGLSPNAYPPFSIGPDEVRGLCGRDPKELQDFDLWVATPADVIGEPKYADIGLTVGRLYQEVPGNGFVEHMLTSVHGIEVDGWDVGLLELDFDFHDEPLPLLPETFPFQIAISTTPALILPSQTTAEWIFPFATDKVSHVRVRARLHGVILDPLQVGQNIATSWVSIVGRH
ncbi:MAG: hypothetical protein GC161_04090 [Planctomycetaceae bacterium]|nr:hypothetical protein [Planctomycetaceae bacterium]